MRRCAWSGELGEALTAAGIQFVAHRDKSAPDAPDDEWLAAAADSGWLVNTRDQRIRYKANEQAAMVRARLHLFVLTQAFPPQKRRASLSARIRRSSAGRAKCRRRRSFRWRDPAP